MNTQTQTIVFVFSGVLVLAGAILYISQWMYAPYLFAAGTAGITLCYLTTPYKQLDFRRRRLHRFNILAGILMIAASSFMFNQRMEWVACLFIAAILQLYTSFVNSTSKKEE